MRAIDAAIAAGLANDAPNAGRGVSLRRAVPANIATIIRAVHRDTDGFVRFMSRSAAEEDLAPLTAARPADLEGVLTSHRAALASDAYFSINSFWRAGTTKGQDLRSLNACFVDLDCSHEEGGITIREAMDLVAAAQERVVIPPASLIVESGRGLWLLFVLYDARTGRPPHAFPDSTIPLARAVNRRLCERLASFAPKLEVDHAASDPSRLCRVAGSTNGRAPGHRVTFHIQTDAEGLGFAYTLRDLATVVGATLRPQRPRRPTKTGRRVPARRRGWEQRWRRVLTDLLDLEHLRQGFRKKHRSNACYVLAYVLQRLGTPDAMVSEGVHALARRCQPPLTPAQANNAIKGARGAPQDPDRLMTNERAAELLAVTREEAKSLKALGKPRRVSEKDPRKAKAEERRLRIEALLAEAAARGEARPSIRSVVAILKAEGLPASVGTISGDLKTISSNPRKLSRRSPNQV